MTKISLLTFIMSLFLPGILSAQTIIFPAEFSNEAKGKSKVNLPIALDTAKWEIVYTHTYRNNDINQFKTDFEMLSIGDSYRWYGGYGAYGLDSIQRVNPQLLDDMTRNEFFQFCNNYKRILASSEMTVNLNDSMINHYGHIFMDYYKYEEAIPKFEWEMEDDTAEILGYECYKATTRWRGREWTAWYCDIPVSSGPWKFNGLPGLILRLEDSEGMHRFEAVMTKKDIYPFGYRKRSYIKTTREKYNDTLKDYKENASKYFSNSGMVKSEAGQNMKSKNKISFFAPIELE